MTYFELGNFLEGIIREYEFRNIKNIDSKVIKKYIENDNGELADFVFFRAQQIEDISKYPSIYKMFDLCSLALSEEERKYVRKKIDSAISSIIDKKESYNFDELSSSKNKSLEKSRAFIEDNIQDFLILENYENKETLWLDRDVCTNESDLKDDVFDIIYDKIKNYLMENGYLSSYHEINEKVGDSIFEEIRYDLNILLSKYILEAYDLLLNNSGNLINKHLFLSITKLENIELGRMVVNILYLIKYYGLNNKLYDTLVYIIDNKKYEKLYELHDNMLKYNANYTSVNYKIDKLVNSNVLYQQKIVLEDLCNDIDWHNGKFTYDDASNLYVILQEENILKKNLLDEDSCLKLCSKKRGGIKCI